MTTAMQESGSVSTMACQMDFKIELRSSLVTMIGGMPMGSRGVVMSPNAHDGSSHRCFEDVRPSQAVLGASHQSPPT